MNDLVNALKLVAFPIHKEGYKFIIIFAVATAILSMLNSSLGLIGLVLTAWCIFFFRDPDRIAPIEDNAVISPADGIITRVEYNADVPKELGYGDVKFNKISIFLNVFNVHVNRVPFSGLVVKTIYKPGKFYSANAEEASFDNERNSVVVKTASGHEIIFVQVAGLIARRIISDIKEGQEIIAGQKYGIIRFGSRVDVYLPEDIEIKSLLGQTTIGGETIIAKINNK
jgi:phosphatidylserine decarboxylase